MKRKMTAIIASLMIGIMLVSGCGMNLYPWQMNWDDKLSEAYDDEFTFKFHHSIAPDYFDIDMNTCYYTSEKCKDRVITVIKRHGQLKSNYMTIRYSDELEDYMKEYYDGMFECDRYEFVTPYANILYPVEKMTFEEFVENEFYITCEFELYYDEEAPSDDEVIEMLEEYARKEKRNFSLTVDIKEAGKYAVAYTIHKDREDHIESIGKREIMLGHDEYTVLVKDLDI